MVLAGDLSVLYLLEWQMRQDDRGVAKQREIWQGGEETARALLGGVRGTPHLWARLPDWCRQRVSCTGKCARQPEDKAPTVRHGFQYLSQGRVGV